LFSKDTFVAALLRSSWWSCWWTAGCEAACQRSCSAILSAEEACCLVQSSIDFLRQDGGWARSLRKPYCSQ